MDRIQVAIACVIAGISFTSVALIVDPTFWWLGLFAGFAAGYLACEFKKTLKAIPEALTECGEGAKRLAKSVADWLKRPHPFMYVATVASIASIILPIHSHIRADLSGLERTTYLLVVRLTMILFFGGLGLILADVFAEIGACYVDHCYWNSEYNRGPFEDLAYKRYGTRQELTNSRAFGWMLLGVIHMLYVLMGPLWVALFWSLIRVVSKFIRLIHCQKRVLCGLDGTLGGVCSYFWLRQPSMNLQSSILLILFGGLLGAAIGLLDWKIVSKRYYKISSVTS